MIKIDAIPFLLTYDIPVMYDITSSPVVIWADCCLRGCHVSLYFTGVLVYDFFERELILRVNDAYALGKIRAEPIFYGLYLRFTVITKIVRLLRN